MAAQHHAMSMQQNTIGAGIVGERIDNRASARERWSASLGMPVWLPVPAGPDPPVLRVGCSTPEGKRPQIELILSRSDFRFSSGLWRRKRHGCDTTATANDGSAALDEGPGPKLAGRLSQLGLRIHHDRSVPRGGFPKRFSRDEHKPDSLLAGSDRYLIATVEEHARAILR